MFDRYSKPQYVEILDECDYSAEAGTYQVCVITSDEYPEKQVVGVSGCADCIGILGWHKDVTLIYHMNEVSLLLSKDPIKQIKNSVPDINIKELQFTLVSLNPERNLGGVLDYLTASGVDASQIAIDTPQSQVFIDRKTGHVSTRCTLSAQEIKEQEQEQESKEIDNRFLNACKEDDVTTVKELMDKARSISQAFKIQNIQEQKECFPILVNRIKDDQDTIAQFIMNMALKNNSAALNALADLHIDLNNNFPSIVGTKIYRSPLIEAIEKGNYDAVETLLNKMDWNNILKQRSPFGKNDVFATAKKYQQSAILSLLEEMKLKHEKPLLVNSQVSFWSSSPVIHFKEESVTTANDNTLT